MEHCKQIVKDSASFDGRNGASEPSSADQCKGDQLDGLIRENVSNRSKLIEANHARMTTELLQCWKACSMDELSSAQTSGCGADPDEKW